MFMSLVDLLKDYKKVRKLAMDLLPERSEVEAMEIKYGERC